MGVALEHGTIETRGPLFRNLRIHHSLEVERRPRWASVVHSRGRAHVHHAGIFSRGDNVRIAIGSDHAGVGHKERIVRWLREHGHDVTDFGTNSTEPVDYPAIIRPVAESIARGDFARGIVLGGSGNGEAIVANRVAGVRCTLCWNEESARYARAHNDSNVLALGERLVPIDMALRVLETWLDTPFEGGRHARRIALIDARDAAPRDLDGEGKLAAPARRDRVERASEESFPASDPPGWSPLQLGAPREHPDAPQA